MDKSANIMVWLVCQYSVMFLPGPVRSHLALPLARWKRGLCFWLLLLNVTGESRSYTMFELVRRE